MVINWRILLVDTLTIGTVIIYPTRQALAQNITTDGTLGTPQTLTGPNYNIPQSLGQTVNSNLFHSFGQFNLNSNEAAIFQSGNDINNIFSRVTGGSPSSINGLIRTLGQDVNLFFLNPSGIIFGPNASLDVSGSFLASTADSFIFGNGLEFSATNPQAAPLLTVNITPGLQYGQNDSSGTIANQGNLTAGQNLELLAGNLDLQGQLQAGQDLTLQADTLKIRDSLTNPFIAAAGNQLLIQGNESVDIFALNNPDSGLFSGGDMILSSANPVIGDIYFWSGGNFQIKKLDDSKGDLFSFYDPIIRSQGDVIFFAYQGASLHILAGGQVDINTAIITNPDTTGESINPTTTPNLANVTLSDGTVLVINGSEQPTLDIRAGVDPSVIGNPLGNLGESGTFFDFSIAPVAPPDNNSVATSADIKIGDIVMLASNGTVLLTNQYEPNLLVQGGDITITGEGLFRTRNARGDLGRIDARGFGGDGSDVFLDSRNNINLSGSPTNPFSGIDTSSNIGNAGDITLLAQDTISLVDNLFVATNVNGGVGNGGDIKITASSVLAENGVRIGSVMWGEGNTGDIEITSNLFSLDRGSIIGTQIGSEGKGKAGNLDITANSILVSNGSVLLTSTLGKGNSGNITLNAEDTVNFDGVLVLSSDFFLSSSAQTNVAPGASGNAGDINISTSSFSLTNGGQLQTSTDGIGDAGNVNIIANKSVLFDGVGGADLLDKGLPSAVFSDVGTRGVGNGGDINVTTPLLSLTDGGQIVASTFGTGHAGNLKINASEAISFDGIGKTGLTSSAFTRVDFGAVGNGGNIEIVTKSLSLTNGAQLIADTRGEGDVGIISINAQEKVSFEGKGIALARGELTEVFSGVFNEVSPGAIGNGNFITINTPLLLLNNDAQISAATFGQGEAGSIKVMANILEITDGGQILVTTFGDFSAGKIFLNLTDKLTLSGAQTGIFADTEEGSSGNGGSILTQNQIPQTVLVKDGATIAVNSDGSGQGGDIILAAEELTLDNGSITAQTTSNKGGNITLNIGDTLSFENSGKITATAGTEQAGGDGGNVTIDAGFILAFPTDNTYEITANAFEGNGGNIQITTNSFFGSEFVDISASSEEGLEGDVSIDVLEVNPAQSLTELPSNIVDASRLIAKSCLAGGEENEFVVTGRGGLPANPNESLRGDAVLPAEWVTLPSEETRVSQIKQSANLSITEEIVEARGWIIGANGNVILTAAPTPTATIEIPWLIPHSCTR